MKNPFFPDSFNLQFIRDHFYLLTIWAQNEKR